MIFHDIGFLNKELEEGHYFFTDIVKEGTMLFDSGKYQLATPKELTGYHRAQKAKLYFKEWFEDASGFFRFFEFGLQEQNYKGAIFQLHQATERYFMTTILVFTDYKPRTHDLEELNKQVGFLDARFKNIFPNKTDEENRLFKLLVKSYIDSRYKLGYTVEAKDLEWLGERVKNLQTAR